MKQDFEKTIDVRSFHVKDYTVVVVWSWNRTIRFPCMQLEQQRRIIAVKIFMIAAAMINCNDWPMVECSVGPLLDG